MNNSVSFLKLAFHTLVFEKWQLNISFFKIKDKDLVSAANVSAHSPIF